MKKPAHLAGFFSAGLSAGFFFTCGCGGVESMRRKTASIDASVAPSSVPLLGGDGFCFGMLD